MLNAANNGSRPHVIRILMHILHPLSHIQLHLHAGRSAATAHLIDASRRHPHNMQSADTICLHGLNAALLIAVAMLTQ